MSPARDADESILSDVLFNQYQAILAGGAVLASLVALSPLPALVWLGAELVFLPMLDTPPFRRMMMRRRRAQEMKDAEAHRRGIVDSLDPPRARRFQQLEDLCGQIVANYEGLSGISKIYLYEQKDKLNAILNGCLQRLVALHKYENLSNRKEPDRLEQEIARLEKELKNPNMTERVRSAFKKNMDLKRTLLESQHLADESKKILAAEFDSLASLLELLHQKSLSIRDPQDISTQLDAILRQVETTDRSIRDMESILSAGGDDLTVNAIPEVGGGAAPNEIRRIKNL